MINSEHSNPSFSFPAPAKLNLFLHITGQRADGYHLLQTLFQLLDRADILHFTPDHSGTIKLAEFADVKTEDNLIYKAAMLLKPYARTSDGVSIRVDKHLPMGGGLGGGSSNAATTLLALNKIWSLNLPQSQLAQLGLTLGADVPVFINGHTAFAEGVGEHLNSIETPPLWYVVLCPKVHVSTAAIFTDPDLTRNSASIDMNTWQFESTRNDCQNLVCQKHPEVAKALRWLLEYAPARMTGTGACVFGMFTSEEQANRVFAMRPKHLDGFVAKGTNQSILLDALQR